MELKNIWNVKFLFTGAAEVPVYAYTEEEAIEWVQKNLWVAPHESIPEEEYNKADTTVEIEDFFDFEVELQT
tara:strand:+ start:201 stop:416 length:216 start_codon:yes stop_codon:yes gene_type:complete